MRIMTVSHSHVAVRQQWFFKEVAQQGHEVLMIAPGEWRDLRTKGDAEVYADIVDPLHFRGKGSFELVTCRHIGGENIYSFQFLGLKDQIEKFKPDWLYVQQEPGSQVVEDCCKIKEKLGCKLALFTWENIYLKGSASLHLSKADLVICGNPEAEELVKLFNPKTKVMLQVGLNTEHFWERPDIKRTIRVGFIGRLVPEKGIAYLSLVWPTVQLCPWTTYELLPWRLSQIEVLVAYSQDKLPEWKEQAPPYIAIEALSNGCKVVVSETLASKYWLEGCPAVIHVPQRDSVALREGIERALNMQVDGRDWVIERFGNPIMAKKLAEALSEG